MREVLSLLLFLGLIGLIMSLSLPALGTKLFGLIQRARGRRALISRKMMYRVIFGLILILGLLLVFWRNEALLNYFVLGVFPFVVWGIVRFLETKAGLQMESSGLEFLRTLEGLVRSGESLSSAVWLVSENDDSAFCQRLQKNLQGYERGRAFADCLGRFRRGLPEGRLSEWLVLLEEANQRGFPVIHLLSTMIESLEIEREARSYRIQIRRWVSWQIVFAVCFPWSLMLALHAFQSESLAAFVETQLFEATTCLVILWQIVGTVILWKMSNYEGRRARRLQTDAAMFVECVSLYLQVGYELGYAWKQAFQRMRTQICQTLSRLVYVPEAKGIWSVLEGSELRRALPLIAPFFESLQLLHRRGAPINSLVRGMAMQLQKHRLHELRAYVQQLPTRLNMVLLLFFLPPALALIFAPLLYTLRSLT